MFYAKDSNSQHVYYFRQKIMAYMLKVWIKLCFVVPPLYPLFLVDTVWTKNLLWEIYIVNCTFTRHSTAYGKQILEVTYDDPR